MQFTNKHPIMTPYKHKLSELIVRYAHEKVLHSGISNTLAKISEKVLAFKRKTI